MSKIIKANNLLVQELEESPIVEDNFGPRDAEKLYEEARGIVEELLGTAQKKARSILADAKGENKVLMDQAYQEGETIKKKGYEDGFSQGREQGYLEADELKEEIKIAIQSAYAEKEKIIAGAEKEIINLAIKIAEKIIKQKIKEDRDAIKIIAKELLDMTKDANYVTLKANAFDLEYLEEYGADLKSMISQGNLKFEVDNSLENGECIVVSQIGVIEAKITPQLEEIKKAFMEVNPNA